jgi:hypothetical protein
LSILGVHSEAILLAESGIGQDWGTVNQGGWRASAELTHGVQNSSRLAKGKWTGEGGGWERKVRGKSARTFALLCFQVVGRASCRFSPVWSDAVRMIPPRGQRMLSPVQKAEAGPPGSGAGANARMLADRFIWDVCHDCCCARKLAATLGESVHR